MGRPSASASSPDLTLADHQLPSDDHAILSIRDSSQPSTFEKLAEHADLRDALDDDAWANSPHNPYAWSSTRKWAVTAIVSAYTFVSPLASSMLAPGLPAIAVKYNITNSTLAALPFSIYILAYAFGPLVISPLSEIYGRKWVLHISNIVFLIFNLVCAWAPNMASLIIFRFLSGIGGSTPVAIGGSVIGDMFPPQDRAAAMAIYIMGPLLGPVLGPMAGGFIAETIGFKWVFIIVTLLAGGAAVFGVFFLSETYQPILRARLIQQCVSDPAKVANLTNGTGGGLSRREVLWINLTRPIALMFRSFILFILSLFMAIQYGNLYLMFATFPDLFPSVYHFSPGITGLMYLGFGIGFFLATIFGAAFSNSVYKKLSARNNGVGKPEFRMPTMLVGSLLVPIGLFWFGWSAQAAAHWIVPVLGSGVFAAGMMLTFLPIQLYLVDAFKYAASALAAASVFRALFGFAFPLFATKMFDALTTGGGYSLLAGIAIVVGWPFPVWIYFYGERIRAMSNLTR